MNNDRFYKNVTIIALALAIFTSYNYYKSTHPYHVPCDASIEYISKIIQNWMRESVSRDFLKTNNLEVADMDGFAEYNSIPHWNKIPLYEDFKNSSVCSASVFIDLSPISTRKENSVQENNQEFSEISVRYQLVKGGNIRMSGFDVDDMMKQVKKVMNKHKKK